MLDELVSTHPTNTTLIGPVRKLQRKLNVVNMVPGVYFKNIIRAYVTASTNQACILKTLNTSLIAMNGTDYYTKPEDITVKC